MTWCRKQEVKIKINPTLSVLTLDSYFPGEMDPFVLMPLSMFKTFPCLEVFPV